ncbi:thermonuclease family protein [Aminobacter sp. AP02]|uniref:thermonuclease family protein n=1 Tax=Aminobacter sp. AP02 TaxID=2135737 RepID=UPI000D6C3EB4|nr:thermonuclease family protein [Aminobacter sp. AP02]PWK64118.1 endonuclease YncB(thermonuclease family) [Aminobacter sp. AP02]
MRPAAIAVAAAGFGIATLLVTFGGHRLAAVEAPSVDAIDEDDLPTDDGIAAVDPSQTEQQEPEATVPDTAEPPSTAQGGLSREAPRAPLSDLSLALPPKPKADEGTTLFHPVASASGLIEAKGLHVAISGVARLDAGETCSFEGKEWNCGTRARTEFRSFLRSRAVVCDVPADAAQGEVVAKCRIGKQDVGEWLAANGWAKADAGGPYADIGKKAETEKKGIYGPPPELIEMTLSPDGTSLPSVEPTVEAPAQ